MADDTKHTPYVFISYSHTDSKYAYRLAEALEQHGVSVWIDERIDYGTQWPHVIQEQLDGCSGLIVIMTPNAYKSEWVQSELSRAKRKGKSIFPLLLEGDEPWLSVESLQYVDVQGSKLPPERFYARLPKTELPESRDVSAPAPAPQPMKQVPRRVVPQKPVPTYAPGTVKKLGGIKFVFVPKGKFIMGSKDDNDLAFPDQKPQHTVEISYDFWIARYLVTNEQFAAFVGATKYKCEMASDWKVRSNHPVVNVSWHGAMAYCTWLNEKLRGELGNLVLRLPTEAEWEKAARGEHGNEWPWGNEFDAARCNSDEGGKETTTPVGAYSPQGDSPYGAADMAGNVEEWCHSLYKPYPYKANDGREEEWSTDVRVVRGGTWLNSQAYLRVAYRLKYRPDDDYFFCGFRVVVAPQLS